MSKTLLSASLFTLLYSLCPVGARAQVGGDNVEAVVEIESQDGNLIFVPLLLLRAGYEVQINTAALDTTAGSGFLLQAAEFGFKGTGFEVFQIELKAGVNELGRFELVDCFARIGLFEDFVALRAGYFRLPLGREFQTPLAKRQMAKTAMAWSSMGLRREPGAQVEGRIAGALSYAAGVWAFGSDGFNVQGRGTGANGFQNGDPDYTVGGGLFYSTPETGPRLRVGGAVLYGRWSDVLLPLPSGGELGYELDRIRFGAEASGRWNGFTLTLEYFWSRTNPSSGVGEDVSSRVPEVDGMGGYGQLGYTIPNRLFELVVRYDVRDEDVNVAGTTMHPAGGFNVFAYGNHVKLQTMYRFNFAVEDPFWLGSGYETSDTHELFFVLQAEL